MNPTLPHFLYVYLLVQTCWSSSTASVALGIPSHTATFSLRTGSLLVARSKHGRFHKSTERYFTYSNINTLSLLYKGIGLFPPRITFTLFNTNSRIRSPHQLKYQISANTQYPNYPHFPLRKESMCHFRFVIYTICGPGCTKKQVVERCSRGEFPFLSQHSGI